MRTTLQLDDALIAEAKVIAARTDRTLSQVIEDALRKTLVPRPRPARRRVNLPTMSGRLLRPGLLDDGVALRDVMDGIE
ncbi:MAG: DUF6364 family protein [Pseudonocardia sp.]|nr:DUF6364 family protein [Pseudonocardia sp.]